MGFSRSELEEMLERARTDLDVINPSERTAYFLSLDNFERSISAYRGPNDVNLKEFREGLKSLAKDFDGGYTFHFEEKED